MKHSRLLPWAKVAPSKTPFVKEAISRPKRFRSQYFCFRMILGSEDVSQEAGEVSGPRDMMNREMME